MKHLLTLVVSLAILVPGAYAKGSHSSTSHSKNYCSACARNSKNKIKRSTGAKHRFEKTHPCASTGRTSGKCPGYVVDHVIPLKGGGADDPSNMQWQSKAAAKAKDRIE